MSNLSEEAARRWRDIPQQILWAQIPIPCSASSAACGEGHHAFLEVLGSGTSYYRPVLEGPRDRACVVGVH